MLNEEEVNNVVNRLKKHPGLLESIKDVSNITEGIKEIEVANDAEFAFIPEVRRLGKKCLEDWAEHQVNEQEAKAREMKLRQHSKKTKLAYDIWDSRYGRKMLPTSRKID
ncbi:hypothetical protein [Neochlamydia sp. AcF84]|uniref:hypothetical protein n=1 Tax=Neochlamydia sp. AcF84 TaxID=2315858 RepID=UPI00140ABF86|nr:hypothetical protein [Neochlamydia sp. AcF84]